MKTARSTPPADSTMQLDTQSKTEPGEFDAGFSEASAEPGRWRSYSGRAGYCPRICSIWATCSSSTCWIFSRRREIVKSCSR